MVDEITVYLMTDTIEGEPATEAPKAKNKKEEKNKSEAEHEKVESVLIFGVIHDALDELVIYTGPESESFWQRLDNAGRINGFGIAKDLALCADGEDRTLRLWPKINDIKERIIVDVLTEAQSGEVAVPERFMREGVIQGMLHELTFGDESIRELWQQGNFGASLTQGQRVARAIATISKRIDTDGWVADSTTKRHKLMAFKLRTPS